MKLRSRLVLGFAYILVSILIALGLSLAVTLENRARSESETNLLVTSQAYAAALGSQRLAPANRQQLQDDVVQLVNRYRSRAPSGGWLGRRGALEQAT
jgi:hypothetical protein